MLEGLSFGWRTALLFAAFVQLLLIAGALVRSMENRTANLTLGMLLVCLAGIITPWMIGFAGFYDKWRWLSFAPFSISLAVAPLTYCYVQAIVSGRWPKGGKWHLLPAVLQFTYLTGAFLILRQPIKNQWLEESNFSYGLIVNFGVAMGLGLYGTASLRLLRQYRLQLAQQRSDDLRFAARWLSNTIVALFILLGFWLGYGFWDLFSPLGYRGLMGLYIAIAAIAVYLAVEGWRHAGQRFPELDSIETVVDATRNWGDQGVQWLSQIRREGLYLDPELNLAGLARKLGTNTGYLSRAFNDGLGKSFSAVIAELRSEAVADALLRGSCEDLLTLAYNCGFSSKASFNRAFSSRFGVSPSAYRRRSVSKSK